MSLNLGNKEIKDIYLGSKKIKEVYHGSKKVYPSKSYPKYLTLTAKADNSSIGYTIGSGGTAISRDIWKSTDGGKTWSKWGGTAITLNNGDSLCVWNKTNTLNNFENSNKFKFTMSGTIEASGDVSSMINFSNTNDGCYVNLFYQCNGLVSCENLYIDPDKKGGYGRFIRMFYGCINLVTPMPTMPDYIKSGDCEYMFHNCTSLTTAPDLPATNALNSAYTYMFSECSSLIEAPELPSTNLVNQGYWGVYAYMFQNCTSLIKAPSILPATDLPSPGGSGQGCYAGMFKNCTSLTKAPYLPASTLKEKCYDNMFYGCSKLNSIKIGPVEQFNYNNSTRNWVTNVSSSGTFYYNGTKTYRGNSYIPTNWTIQRF